MSGYRTDNISAAYGETLLMRTLPLVTNPRRRALYGGSVNFKHISSPILDALIVSSADGSADSVYRRELPVAHECMLSWCVKTIRSSYSWGAYEEKVEDIFFNTSKTPFPWSTVYRPELMATDTDFHYNISLYPPGTSRDGPGYSVSNETFLDVVEILDEVFPSLITVADPSARPFLKIRTSFTDRVMFRDFHFNPFLAPNNVTNHIAGMATAITNVVRSDPANNEFITGQAFAPETYVAVRWAWLAFPLAMLSLCAIFLIATMIKTSKGGHEELGTWKTSAMPTLIYSLPQDMRQNLTTTSTCRSIVDVGAKKVKIRLKPDQGWRVSGQMRPASTLLSRTNPQPPPGWL
jgi:hypothetical protein